MLNNAAHLVYIAISPILSAMLAFINIITIYIFYKMFKLASLSLIVMINICACDIFVCLISNTFYVVSLVHPVHSWSTGPIACKIFKFSTMLTNIAQIYFLCILNTDWIRRLLKGSSKQWGKKHGILFVSIGWLAAFLISVPRLFLFDEEVRQSTAPNQSDQYVEVYHCKPVGLSGQSNICITIITFIMAYAIPACYITYTMTACQLFMWRRRRQIHISTTSNAVARMHSKLAFTFNLTGALFIIIWTPFFILSLVDLNTKLTDGDILISFSLRCTLLILGSAKPIIYLICLDKFRNCFSFKQIVEKTSGSICDAGTCSTKTKVATSTVNTEVAQSKF